MVCHENQDGKKSRNGESTGGDSVVADKVSLRNGFWIPSCGAMWTCVTIEANADASLTLSTRVERIAFIRSKVTAIRVGGAASSTVNLCECVAFLSDLIASRTRPSFVAFAGVRSRIADASDSISAVFARFALRSSCWLRVTESARVSGINLSSNSYPSSQTQTPPSAVEHTPWSPQSMESQI
mgnify:FL=1